MHTAEGETTDENRLAAVAAASNQTIVGFDSDLHLTFVHGEAFAGYARNVQLIVGRRLDELPDVIYERLAPHLNAVLRGVPSCVELVMPRGAPRMLARFAPVAPAWPPSDAGVIVFKELDARVAELAHDLRTPLTSVTTALTLLSEDEGLSASHVELVEIARANAARMADLTSRADRTPVLDAEQLARPASVNLADAVRGVIAQRSVDARARGITVRADLAPLDVLVSVPAVVLEEVSTYLLDNAIKYTPPGGLIEVRARARQGRTEIAVADNGIGVPRAERKAIFQRHYRAANVEDHASGGDGLGLALAQELIAGHGGSITCHGRRGEGSVFVVSVPAPGARTRFRTGEAARWKVADR